MANISRLSIVKFLELLIVCILIGLHYHSNSVYNVHTEMLTMGTFGGYLIILIGLFAGALMSTPINRRLDLFFSVLGVALFITVGALNIDFFERFQRSEMRNIGLAKGSISIIEGALFLCDAFLTYRGES
jgi:hypothetical protein